VGASFGNKGAQTAYHPDRPRLVHVLRDKRCVRCGTENLSWQDIKLGRCSGALLVESEDVAGGTDAAGR
jgi:hypothetical protein